MPDMSAMKPEEWPWLLYRSTMTAWAQMTPEHQGATTPAALAARVQQMLSRSLAQPGATALVAREQGAPVGYIVVCVTPDELSGAPTGLFFDIYVEPRWRGKGLSTELTAAGEQHLRQLGIKLLRRWIATQNRASLRHALGDGCAVERVSLTKRL